MTAEELPARAIEAVLLVAVEPVPPGHPGRAARRAGRPGRGGLRPAGRRLRRPRAGGSWWPGSPAGYRFQTHPDLAPYVERFANRDVSHRLSTAALETLAIVAYRQPVSRAQISSLRGVNVDGRGPPARAAGLHRGGGAGRGPRPARPLRHHRPVLGAPGPRPLDQLPAGGGLPARARGGRGARGAGCGRRAGPAGDAPTEEAEGRAAPEGAVPGGPGEPAGLRRADRRRPGHGRTARRPSSASGSTRPRRAWPSTGSRCRRPRGWSTTCLNKPAGAW